MAVKSFRARAHQYRCHYAKRKLSTNAVRYTYPQVLAAKRLASD